MAAPLNTPLNTPRRLKTYSAESGYVYQYYFLESRPLQRLWTRTGTLFLFHATTDCKNYFVVQVIVQEKALQAWECNHGRALAAQEQYAAAKMRLFRAFDETERPGGMDQAIVTEANIEELLEPLNLDG